MSKSISLEKLLDCRVEVVTEKALNSELRARVLTEAISDMKGIV